MKKKTFAIAIPLTVLGVAAIIWASNRRADAEMVFVDDLGQPPAMT